MSVRIRLVFIILFLVAFDIALISEAHGSGFQCPRLFRSLTFQPDPRLVPDKKGGLSLSMLPPDTDHRNPLQVIPFLYGRLLGVPALSRAFQAVQADTRDVSWYTKWSDGFGVEVETNPEALSRIPREGGVLAVANHPLFGVDGAAIAKTIESVRPDVKVVMTESFENIPGMADKAIFVSVMDTPEGKAKNVRVLRESMKWLKEGHVLVIFPSGSPSGVLRDGLNTPLDLPWSASIGRMARKTGAQALPVYVEGRGSSLYLLLRKFDLTRPLASMRLMNEIGLVRGKTVPLTFGEPVADFGFLGQEGKAPTDEAIAQFLRDRTYELGGIPSHLSRVDENGKLIDSPPK